MRASSERRTTASSEIASGERPRRRATRGLVRRLRGADPHPRKAVSRHSGYSREMSDGPRETEVKFRVEGREALEERLRALGATHEEVENEVNLLLDDDEMSLRLSGRALRVRTVDGLGLLTFKGPATFEGGIKSRLELESCVDDPGADPRPLRRTRLPAPLPLREAADDVAFRRPRAAARRPRRDASRPLRRDRGRRRRHPRPGGRAGRRRERLPARLLLGPLAGGTRGRSRPSPRHALPAMKALVPAAGFGTRFRPATLTTPKPLLPLLGVPILVRALPSPARRGGDVGRRERPPPRRDADDGRRRVVRGDSRRLVAGGPDPRNRRRDSPGGRAGPPRRRAVPRRQRRPLHDAPLRPSSRRVRLARRRLRPRRPSPRGAGGDRALGRRDGPPRVARETSAPSRRRPARGSSPVSSSPRPRSSIGYLQASRSSRATSFVPRRRNGTAPSRSSRTASPKTVSGSTSARRRSSRRPRRRSPPRASPRSSPGAEPGPARARPTRRSRSSRSPA